MRQGLVPEPVNAEDVQMKYFQIELRNVEDYKNTKFGYVRGWRRPSPEEALELLKNETDTDNCYVSYISDINADWLFKEYGKATVESWPVLR